MSDHQGSDAPKPRIAIMGEFSAGKSTLCNLLLRTRSLPERVTATRLAPVWMTKGYGDHMRVTLDGAEEPIALDTLDGIPIEDTRYIRLCLDAEILDLCDFIDFPGISDPNMDSEVWERVLDEADAVIWLTHATQAWRQSEAAVWEMVADEVKAKSVLLVTRFDKLTSELDRKRVLSRLAKETGHLFHKMFPISLIEAIAAEDDYDAWTNSGAAAFIDHLAGLISDLNDGTAPAALPDADAVMANVAALDTPVASLQAEPAACAEPSNVTRIVPRRVKPLGVRRRGRPGGMGLHSLGAD